METQDIPQDNSTTYHGHRKVIYATQNGQYVKATSNGWQAEAFATEQAVADLDEQCTQAKLAVQAGEYSPLYYYMYFFRYDEATLCATTGLFRWQLRRHFRPKHFNRLSNKILQRYANAFGLTINDIKNHRLPEK